MKHLTRDVPIVSVQTVSVVLTVAQEMCSRSRIAVIILAAAR